MPTPTFIDNTLSMDYPTPLHFHKKILIPPSMISQISQTPINKGGVNIHTMQPLSQGSFQPNSTGVWNRCSQSSSNCYHLFVSMRKVFPENFSFTAQFKKSQLTL